MANHPDLYDAIPRLQSLSTAELDDAIGRGGLLGAAISATVKELSSVPKRGRPRGKTKARKTIQRRGRTVGRMSVNSTNIQLAQYAKLVAEILSVSHSEAAKRTLMEVTGRCSPRDVRRLAKLVSELSGRNHDRQARRAPNSSPEPIYGKRYVAEMLKDAANA